MSSAAEDLLDGIRVILRVFTVDEHRFPPAEGRIKYNAVDFQALNFIAESPQCSSRALAQLLGIAPTTAQSVCDRLIKRGFLTRSESASDRRSIALTLTREGESVVAAIRRQDLANCETMLRALPSGTRRAFADQVGRIAQSLGETESTSAQ